MPHQSHLHHLKLLLLLKLRLRLNHLQSTLSPVKPSRLPLNKQRCQLGRLNRLTRCPDTHN